MSAEPVTATVLGQTVEGTELDRISSGDFSSGPTETVVVEVEGSTYRVDEEDVQ